MGAWHISLDTTEADAIPYFNWDAPVTNAAVRLGLVEGTEGEKVFGIARIGRGEGYPDACRYVRLGRDGLP